MNSKEALKVGSQILDIFKCPTAGEHNEVCKK